MAIIVTPRIQAALTWIYDASVLFVFFFVAWWLRPDGLPDNPYFLGFLITVPVALSLATWALRGLPGLSGAFRDSRFWWIMFLTGMATWALLSARWSSHPDVALGAGLQLVVVALFAVAVTCAGPGARKVAWALAAGLLVQGMIVFLQMQLQRPVGLAFLGEFEIRPGRVGLSIITNGADTLMRPYGLTIHPNVIGGYFVVALLALTPWLTIPTGQPDQKRSAWLLVLRYALLGLGLYCLCLTFSRSAWGAFFVGLAFLGGASLRSQPLRQMALHWRRNWPVDLGAAALIGFFALTYPSYILARGGVGDEVIEQRSISDRRVYTQIALQVIREEPVRGVGIGVFPWRASEILHTPAYAGIDLPGDYVHNMPLLVLAELGVAGFVLFGLALLSGFTCVWQRVNDPYARGLAAGTLALLAVGLLDHYPWSIFHFALLLWGSLGIAQYKPYSARNAANQESALSDAAGGSGALSSGSKPGGT